MPNFVLLGQETCQLATLVEAASMFQFPPLLSREMSPRNPLHWTSELVLFLLFALYAWTALQKALSGRTAMSAKETPANAFRFPSVAFVVPDWTDSDSGGGGGGDPRDRVIKAWQYLYLNDTYG